MIRTAIAMTLYAAAMPVCAETIATGSRPQTVIAFAGNGGIRNFERSRTDATIVYLQDRTQRWYEVTLTGPCLPDNTLDTISFRTDPSGTFDRFSQIVSRRYPTQVCGVTSIVASPPPPGQPGAPK